MTARPVLNGGDASGLAAAIKAKTDNLPTDPGDQSAIEAAITAAVGTLANTGGVATLAAMLGDPANSSLVARLALLYTDSQKIAAANAGGLAATADSLAYGIGEIERHFHGWDR